uniref:Uncharacterized protein n=1 Tax=Cajanus cajan TaxID=3821 RepID=A0A151TBS1_CAJCA|nr:hypothetical protein KK1_019048 [Cajanus cajan]KYP64454.1 hypothetical protein KK1_019053 [Cajanus cajan]
MREKRLSEIPVPRDLGIAFTRQIYPLKGIGECLCFCFSSVFDGRKLEMWVMKEYKVESSWIKLFVLSTHRARVTPLNYPISLTKNGEILVLNVDKMLLRLNYKGEVLEYCDYTDKLGFGRCTLYRESLLSLPGDY